MLWRRAMGLGRYAGGSGDGGGGSGGGGSGGGGSGGEEAEGAGEVRFLSW